MTQKIKHAFLLAAGLGTRMGLYTKDQPKPMLQVGGLPLIFYSLYTLKKLAVENVVINTHYKANQIVDFLIPYLQKLPFNISFSHEPQILGTAGALKKAIVEKKIPDDYFYLLNTDLILEPLMVPDRQLPANCRSYLFLKEKNSSSRETGLSLGPENKIEFNAAAGQYYYIGFSVIHSLLLSSIPPDQVFELGDLWRQADRQGCLMGQNYRGRLLSCGNRNEYENAKERIPDFLKDDKEFNEFCRLFSL